MGKSYTPKLKNNAIHFYAKNPVEYSHNLSNRYQVELENIIAADWLESHNNIQITLSATNHSSNLLPNNNILSKSSGSVEDKESQQLQSQSSSSTTAETAKFC